MHNVDKQIKEKEREIKLLRKQKEDIKNKKIDEICADIDDKIAKIKSSDIEIKALYVSPDLSDRMESRIQHVINLCNLCNPYLIIDRKFKYAGIKTYTNYHFSKYEYQIGI